MLTLDSITQRRNHLLELFDINWKSYEPKIDNLDIAMTCREITIKWDGFTFQREFSTHKYSEILGILELIDIEGVYEIQLSINMHGPSDVTYKAWV